MPTEDDKKLAQADLQRTLAEVQKYAKRHGAEAETVTFGDLEHGYAGPDADEKVLASLVIGERGDLTRQAAKRAAQAYNNIVRLQPQAVIAIAVAGYDTDPREVFEIEEARIHFCRWARFLGMRSVHQALASQLHPHSVGVLAKCGAFLDFSPGNVKVVGPPSMAQH